MSTIEELDRVLLGIEEARRRDHAAIDEKYEADIAVLKRARQLLLQHANGSIPSGNSEQIARSGGGMKWPGLRAAIRESIRNRPEKFTLDHVMADLEKYEGKPQINRVAVSGELWRMCRQKDIKIVKKGRPNVYHRKEAEQSGPERVATTSGPSSVP